MRYVRPISPELLSEGVPGEWLVGNQDEECAIRALRPAASNHEQESVAASERCYFVLSGRARVYSRGIANIAPTESLVFVPSGVPVALGNDDGAVVVEMIIGVSAASDGAGASKEIRIVEVDESKFEGTGFAYQSLVDMKTGSAASRLNMLQVTPGSGSPNFHIHVFDQIYIILEGEMCIDAGKLRYKARKHDLVYLPAGLVHRNFNVASGVERHISLLVREPLQGEVFDYAVDIHGREAELMTDLTPEALEVN